MSQIGYVIEKCPFCAQRVAKYTLENHIRYHHPEQFDFFVTDEMLNDQSNLADLCEICDCRTRNIMQHIRKYHPEKYEKFKYGEE